MKVREKAKTWRLLLLGKEEFQGATQRLLRLWYTYALSRPLCLEGLGGGFLSTSVSSAPSPPQTLAGQNLQLNWESRGAPPKGSLPTFRNRTKGYSK